MTYSAQDLRSRLASGSAVAKPEVRGAGVNVAPQYFELERLPPTEVTSAGSSSWWIRSQACVVSYAVACAGDRLARADQPDEYVVLLPDEHASATIVAGTGEPVGVAGRSLIVVPPGESTVEPSTDCVVIRLFTTRSLDLCARCTNAAFYATPDPNVAPFLAWPDPPAGPRVRSYAIDAVAPDPNRFGRIYRSSTVMVNWFYPDPGPRDPARLSPHHHDDFEQLSLQLEGDYVHHIRTPWTVALAGWRDDEHQHCTSPALTIIPPPAIHTSQGVGDTPHLLIDIFCPPRADFSAQPGWVLNAADYPMPPG